MVYIAIAVAAFLMAVFIEFSGVRAQITVPEKPKVSDVTTAETKTLKRADIKQRLEALAKSKAPEIKQMSAMCYDTAGPPRTANYICPKCGEKTLYKLEDGGKDTNICQKIFSIEGARHLAKSVKNLSIELDESQFCRNCSPDVKSPQLNLIVKYEGDKEHRVNNISDEDMKLIYEFSLGLDIHTMMNSETMTTDQSPIKNHIKRLSELLGVEVEIPEKTTNEK